MTSSDVSFESSNTFLLFILEFCDGLKSFGINHKPKPCPELSKIKSILLMGLKKKKTLDLVGIKTVLFQVYKFKMLFDTRKMLNL